MKISYFLYSLLVSAWVFTDAPLYNRSRPKISAITVNKSRPGRGLTKSTEIKGYLKNTADEDRLLPLLFQSFLERWFMIREDSPFL